MALVGFGRRVRGGFAWVCWLGALLAPAGVRADGVVHVVESGDSLEAIATRYQVSQAELRQRNHLVNDSLRLGQRLTIEGPPTLRHRVGPGDTLGCLAQRYGVELEDLHTSNPGLDPERLAIGQVVEMPSATAPFAGLSPPRSAEVSPGDSLARLARRFGTTVSILRAVNPELDPERIRSGTRIALPDPSERVHAVRAGETLPGLARRYDTTVERLEADNPALTSSGLLVGAQLRITLASESVGSPNCGMIVGGRALGPHPAYVLRTGDRAWATAATVRHTRRAFTLFRQENPSAPRVRVHDLSRPRGGPIDDHRSHQSGRDVDVTYVRSEGCPRALGCPMRSVSTEQLDAMAQWSLLRAFIATDAVEVIFVDYALQRVLYEAAQEAGASAEELETTLQFPRGRWDEVGIIRHFPHHRDHFHVRFACRSEERRCRD